MSAVGYIVGEVRTDEFTFVTNREIAPPRLEYIVVQVQEPTRKIDVLAQVTGLAVSSRLLDRTLSYTEVESVEGEAGDFQVTLLRKPRYIQDDKCRGCTACTEVWVKGGVYKPGPLGGGASVSDSFLILPGVDAGLAAPPFTAGCDGAEQVLGIGAVGGDIIIPENDHLPFE